jgi:hypothetical protein
MHIAYSALYQVSPVNQSTQLICDKNSEVSEPLLRYQAYQAACQKLSHEIAAIQKYIPGWMPAFR